MRITVMREVVDAARDIGKLAKVQTEAKSSVAG